MMKLLVITALGAMAFAQADGVVRQSDLDAPDVSASERAPRPPAPAAPPPPPPPAPRVESAPAPAPAPAAPAAAPARPAPRATASTGPHKAVAAFWFILPGK